MPVTPLSGIKDKDMRITGNEKAVIGGLVSALVTIAVQLADTPHFTWHDVLVAVGAYIVTHLTVYVTANTPKTPPSTPSAPVANI